MPGSPFAYWVSERVRGLFTELPPFEGEGRTACLGASSKNDFRFLRLWWEVPAQKVGRTLEETKQGRPWVLVAKGGAYSPFYADLYMVINWGQDAREIDAEVIGKYPYLKGDAEWVLHRANPYFRPGLTWTIRTTSAFAPRILPAGCIFSHKGPSVFSRKGPSNLLPALALSLSKAFASLLALQLAAAQAAARSYEIGLIKRTPVPFLGNAQEHRLSALAQNGWKVRRSLDSANQTSHAFLLPAFLQVDGLSLAARTDVWCTRILETQSELTQIQSEIDAIAFDLYGIDGEDRRQMEGGIDSLGEIDEAAHESREERDSNDQPAGADPVALTESLFEWALGAALGRFDVRLATGERQPLTDTAPFDPLPLCSPGMLQDNEGLPATETPPGYPLELPPHGILVDDPGHPWDVVSRMEAVFDVVAREHAQAWILEAESIVGRDLRDWLRRYGLERHLRWYSLSRRKAPLFWHLAPSSRAYGIWLYSPVASRDSLYRILNDYVTPRMKRAERRLMELWQEAGDRPTGRQRQDLTSQESLVEELQAFRGEVARAAPLWAPHRCDGIILNCAVLWRLFGHHRVWQNGCKSKWGELAQGKYDWSGWAMRLWPERALKACAKDRSVAIAHGLEDTLWETDDDQKWMPRSDAGEKITALMAERRSPAIEAALDEFMRSV